METPPLVRIAPARYASQGATMTSAVTPVTTSAPTSRPHDPAWRSPSTTTRNARATGIGISSWIWRRPQAPSRTPASAAQAIGTRPVVGRPQERQHRERQEPEHEVARVDRVERLPDHEHRVDPQAVRGQVEAAGEGREDGGHQGDVTAPGEAPREEVRAERDDRQPEQSEDGRGGRQVRREEPGEAGQQEMEAGRVVGGEPEVRPLGREGADQDRVRQAPVVEEVTAGVERGERPGAVDREGAQQQESEPPFGPRDRREALSYTPDRSPDAAADRQVAGHAP